MASTEKKQPTTQEEPAKPGFKPKKSVALSGVVAGNTALCTVGKNGNELHYRGYDILDIAQTSEFEEIAYLLVHGKLPNEGELRGYKAKLKSLRGLPAAVQDALEALPAACHPMDVLRTAVSVLGCVLPERDDHSASHAWVDVWLDEPQRWFAVDVTNGVPGGPHHCRLAVGRDYLDACPVRGVRRGGGTETMAATVAVSSDELPRRIAAPRPRLLQQRQAQQ